jgi:hypothetical protein
LAEEVETQWYLRNERLLLRKVVLHSCIPTFTNKCCWLRSYSANKIFVWIVTTMDFRRIEWKKWKNYIHFRFFFFFFLFPCRNKVSSIFRARSIAFCLCSLLDV